MKRNKLQIIGVKIEHKPDADPDTIGIISKAELRNPETSVTQVIRSGGLWGIESDSDKEYLAEVENEQLAELRAELLALGIGPRAIAHAVKSVQHLS